MQDMKNSNRLVIQNFFTYLHKDQANFYVFNEVTIKFMQVFKLLFILTIIQDFINFVENSSVKFTIIQVILVIKE